MQSQNITSFKSRDNKPEHNSWMNMIQRCTNPSADKFRYYGGRGIRVCPRWRVFANFLADMGRRPAGKTLDRYPDNDGNYEPGNCRWATRAEQRLNQRPRQNPHSEITFNGKTLHINEWAAELHIGVNGLYNRLARGWTIERALTQHPQPNVLKK